LLLRINAVTRANREEIIARVRNAMTVSGAWVLDVKLFSNVSACFSFEIPGNHLGKLREALAATELRVIKESDDSLSRLVDLHALDAGSLHVPDIAGTLQITFVHGEPDLRIEVPKIPG
jgi:hypothetical protein